jgi:hypothetical protein
MPHFPFKEGRKNAGDRKVRFFFILKKLFHNPNIAIFEIQLS